MILTEKQAHLLAALERVTKDGYGAPASAVALAAWPDSPGWRKRSHRHATRAGGAMGVGLPMVAGRLLRQLGDAGLVAHRYREHTAGTWHLTAGGRAVLEAYRQGHWPITVMGA